MPGPGEGTTQLSCPQHCPIPTPDTYEAKAHLLNVVAMLLLGHRYVLVNCRDGRARYWRRGYHSRPKPACPDGGRPPGASPRPPEPEPQGRG